MPLGLEQHYKINLYSLCRYLYLNFIVLFQTTEAFQLMTKFEFIKGVKLELWEKYVKILHSFHKEIDNTRKIYTRQCKDPPLARNVPPVRIVTIV